MYDYKFRRLRFLITIFIGLLLLTTSASHIYAQNSEKELFIVAQKAFEDGFYDVAMRYINQLLEEYPRTDKRIQANLLLGQCHFFKSQYLKAYDIFQDLLTYSEFKDATLFWLGETYLKGADYKQAEKQYRQLIDLYPDSIYAPQAYYSLGWSHFEQGEFPKAKEAFLQLIRKFPSHQLVEDASFKLAETEYNFHAYEDTIRSFKNYIRKFPQSRRHAQAYFYIAESYYYLENFLTAVTYYAKTAEIAYDNKLILMAKVSLGWSYLKLERFKIAQQYFDEAYQFAREKGILSDDVFLGQATFYAEIGEPEKALDAYKQLIEKFPHSERITEDEITLKFSCCQPEIMRTNPSAACSFTYHFWRSILKSAFPEAEAQMLGTMGFGAPVCGLKFLLNPSPEEKEAARVSLEELKKQSSYTSLQDE